MGYSVPFSSSRSESCVAWQWDSDGVPTVGPYSTRGHADLYMQLIMRDINKGTLKNKYSWDQIFSLVLHQNQNILVRNYPFHWIKSHWNYSCASRQIDTYCWLSFLNFSIILIIWLIFLQETSKFFTVYWFAFFFFGVCNMVVVCFYTIISIQSVENVNQVITWNF